MSFSVFIYRFVILETKKNRMEYLIKIAFPIIDSILKDEHFDLFGGYITNCFDLIIMKEVELYKVIL